MSDDTDDHERVVQHREDGPVRYRNAQRGVATARGDTVTCGQEDADYLVDETGYFDYAESDPGAEPEASISLQTEDASAEDAADGDADDADDEEDEPTCAGKDGECTRAVDEAGDYCWQHD